MDGESVRPPKWQMGPQEHNNTGENRKKALSIKIITSTEMNCMIKFRRVNVSQSARGSRSRQRKYDLEPT